jgi:MFS transporter, DHA2 family, multidrug resistance protein
MFTNQAVHTTGSRLAGGRRWVALAVLNLAVLVLTIDATVLYLAVPALTADLHPSSTQLLWIGDVYSLVLAGLLLTMGALADRFGRKKVLLLGSAAFGGASLLAGLSTSPTMLIVARVLQGVAGATLMPSTLSMIRNIFPDAVERRRAIALWAATSSAGAALGPLVGGVLLEHGSWGLVFLINIPLMALLVVAGSILLPESRNPHGHPIDLASAGLSMAAIVPITFAIKHTMGEGIDRIGIAALAFGVAAALLFVRRQKVLEIPMIDVALFRKPAFTGAVLADFAAVFALTGLLYFFSQYLQLARGFSPLRAGLAELPATIASIAVLLLVGRLLARLGVGRAIALGLVLVALGFAGVAMAEGASNYLWLGLALVPVGLGVGLSQTVTTDAVVTMVPEHKAGAASAIIETTYELGGALGIAVLGSAVTMVYRSNLPTLHGLSPEQSGAVQDSLASASAVLAPHTPALHTAQTAFVGAMQTTAVIAALVTLVAAVIAYRVIPARVKSR